MDRTSFLSRNQTNVPMPAIMPRAAMFGMPSVNGISGLGDTTTTSALAPTDVAQRLPSIVNPTPVDLGAACDPFPAWVAANSALAIGGLAVVAYFTIFNKKGGK